VEFVENVKTGKEAVMIRQIAKSLKRFMFDLNDAETWDNIRQATMDVIGKYKSICDVQVACGDTCVPHSAVVDISFQNVRNKNYKHLRFALGPKISDFPRLILNNDCPSSFRQLVQ
jgi:hypothetical protein